MLLSRKINIGYKCILTNRCFICKCDVKFNEMCTHYSKSLNFETLINFTDYYTVGLIN